jgi:anhydro-N-acetylmuramic acid kinase
MKVIGIMSGTSCDGADAVLLELASASEPHEPEVLAHAFEPYPEDVRRDLLAPDRLSVPRLAELHYALPEIYARAAKRLPGYDAAACCGMHGQTLWHAPRSSGAAIPCTLQIGVPGVLAERLGVPVVSDFRAADVARGGEGAPIVPFSHWFFTTAANRPRVYVNFGGIANLTYVGPTPDDVRGWDVGPAMMISDAHAAQASNGALDCDREGALSASGALIPELVAAITSHPFLSRMPPKSTGREDFGEAFFAPILARFADRKSAAVATSILAATARGLADAILRDPLASAAKSVVLTGRGAKNPTLVRWVKELLPGRDVRVVTTGVFAPSCHEPAAMALFAARTMAGLTSSLPAVTGAREAARLGSVSWA